MNIRGRGTGDKTVHAPRDEFKGHKGGETLRFPTFCAS